MGLFRQAIIHLDTNQLLGYEVLLAHPRETLNLASASGTLLDLDQFILKTAYGMANKEAHLLIFVNVAAESLIARLLPFAPDGIPNNLVLEISERVPMDMNEIREFLKPYRKQGLQIALTDVTTGVKMFNDYAALMPDFLKLHWTDHKDTLRAGVSCARSLNLPLVIGRIETKDQANWALRCGIPYAQGFHYGRMEEVAL